MPLGRKARGDPQVTTYSDAVKVFALARLSKKDRFCDLGCGYGWMVRWAARRCAYAYGIENYSKNLERARRNIRNVKNAEIIKGDFLKDRLPYANVLYSVSTLYPADFRRWARLKIKNLRIVTFGPPPIPIKPVASKGVFYLTKFPYELAKNRGEWYRAVIGKGNASWEDVRRKLRPWLKREAIHYLEQDFKREFPDKCKGCNEEIDERFIILKTDRFIVNHKMGFATLGQLVLMPRRRDRKVNGSYHATDPRTLTEDEFNGIIKLLPEIISAMNKVVPAILRRRLERIYVATFNEDTDWHFHIHIVPRYRGMRGGPKLITRKELPRVDNVLKVVTEMRKRLTH